MYDSSRNFNNQGSILFVSEGLESIKDGTLVIGRNKEKIKVNDHILFYNFYTNQKKILEGQVLNLEEKTNSSFTYEIENNRFVPSRYVIGNLQDSLKIPHLGAIFNFLSTPLTYFAFALLPTFALFFYHLFNLFKKDNSKGGQDVKEA